MAEAKKRTVNDVSHPSKTAASPTSRPVIVRHGPMIEDPTVKKAEAEAADAKAKEKAQFEAAHKKDKVIEAPKEVKADEPDVEVDKTDKGTDDQLAKDAADSKSSEDESTENEESSVNDDGSPKPATAAQASEASKEEEARLAAVEKLVESKKYFLPIREAKRKRRTRMTLLVLVLLLVVGLAVSDLLIDAGIIKTDIPPLANLIKN